MTIDHILSSITNTPLMITPDKLAVIMDVLSSRSPFSLDMGRLAAAAPAPAAAAPMARRANRTDAEGIGIISIVGSLVNRAMPGDSGIVSYRGVKRQLDKLMDDRDIGGIILDIDSRGGLAAGVYRLAREIRAAAEVKPIYAFVDTQAFSAAYYLASAASKIILADETAGVGSVGVIAMHRDQSGHNEKEGYVYTVIYSGARKNDYSPHSPLSKEIIAELQQQIDAGRLAFATAVAGFRGLDVQKVLDTEAGLFYGADAIRIGFADDIGTIDETVAMLVADIRKQSQSSGGSQKMTTRERLEAIITKNEDGHEALAELGYVQAEQAETEAKKAGYEEGLRAGLARAKELLDVAAIGDAPLKLATDMIDKGLSQEEAVATVQQYRASLSAAGSVSSTITPLSGDGKHPLIAACEQMAG